MDLKKSDIESYMQSQSMVWEELPMQWNEGAFVGNGRVGMVIYVDSLDNSLTLWLSRADVTDHRMAPDRKTSMGVMGASVITDFARLDVGKMKMYPESKILSGRMTLDIYDGILDGVLETEGGNIDFTAYVPYNDEVNVVEISTKVPYEWKLTDLNSDSPRNKVFKLKDYTKNPEPEFENKKNCGYSVNSLLAGGDYATYWQLEKSNSRLERAASSNSSLDKSILFVSTKNEIPKSGLSLPKAKKEVEKAIKCGPEKLKTDSRNWWHSYYTKGILSIPDKQMENFYNIQMYKLAVNSAKNGPAMDVLGLFYKTTSWPGVWWNLNVQLTYESTLPTNRLEQGYNYLYLIDNYWEDMMHASGNGKVGDFAWSLNVYYSYMQYAGYSLKTIAKRFIPKAQVLLKIYRESIKKIDGVYHLLQVESPEYEGFKVYDNSNYNLANLRWILTKIVELEKQTHVQVDNLEQIHDLLDNLHEPPMDENGFMIGSNKPFAKSHRHYSHLLGFYPLRLYAPTKPEVKEVLEKSINHWFNIENGKYLAGYSYTGAASLYSFLGDGNKAYELLHHFLNEPIGISILLPNTLYVEWNGRSPVIETPLSAVTALSEMLLQSWHGVLRVFPAVPKKWQDLTFKELRAEGGFDVSASRTDGQLDWIEIHSEKGRPCKIYLPDRDNFNFYHSNSSSVTVDSNGVSTVKAVFEEGAGRKGINRINKKVFNKITSLGDDYYELDIKKGKYLLILSKTAQNHTSESTGIHYYGLKKGEELDRLMYWPKVNGEKYY